MTRSETKKNTLNIILPQFGVNAYKRFHICETALLRVHNDLSRAVDNRCCVVLLLLALSTAFDTVDHNILLSRLESRHAILVKHGSASNSIFLNVLSCYASTRHFFISGIDLRRTSRLCVRPSPLPFLYITCGGHSGTSQYGFLSLHRRHLVLCFFLL